MTISRRTLMGAAAGVAAVAGAAGPVPRAAAAGGLGGPSQGDVRVLTWNIYKGGHGVGEDNLPKVLDQLVKIKPDVYLAVETYGSGPQIRDALSRRAGNGPYTGIKITDRPAGRDNLWIFTHLPVLEIYPKPAGGQHITDFNLGGARLQLPGGRELNVFDLWLNYTDPWIGYLIDENAAGTRAGLAPRHSVDDVVDADRRQTAQLEEVVAQHLPAMTGASSAPTVIGGDLNTLPAGDWTTEFASGPNHLGMSYPLTATPVLERAGFRDTFRVANPDATAVEGRTWCPLPTERLITPQRIDMIWASGNVDVQRSTVVDERMEDHGPGTFYSDHAAVFSDLTVG